MKIRVTNLGTKGRPVEQEYEIVQTFEYFFEQEEYEIVQTFEYFGFNFALVKAPFWSERRRYYGVVETTTGAFAECFHISTIKKSKEKAIERLERHGAEKTKEAIKFAGATSKGELVKC